MDDSNRNFNGVSPPNEMKRDFCKNFFDGIEVLFAFSLPPLLPSCSLCCHPPHPFVLLDRVGLSYLVFFLI